MRLTSGRKNALLAVVIGGLVLSTAFAGEGGKNDPSGTVGTGETAVQLKPQTTCPVMGGAIDKKVYTDYKGKRIYFCCPGCIATFKKDPEKYLKVLSDKGESVEVIKKLKPQTLCPVMGEKIDKTVYIDYQGKRVYFCCEGCITTFKENPEKYLKKIQDAGEEPETIKK
jgi:YHS domain-containing protein